MRLGKQVVNSKGDNPSPLYSLTSRVEQSYDIFWTKIMKAFVFDTVGREYRILSFSDQFSYLGGKSLFKNK